MKRVLIVILLVLPLVVSAQNPIQFQIGTRSGYEYNVFNANPNRLIVSEEGDSTSSVRSGFFQHFDVQANWKKKFDAHQLSAKVRTRYDYFPQVNAANLFRPELSLGYGYKFNKKTSLFLKTRYLKYQTNRIPDDTESLILPPAYQRLGADVGLKFKPRKNNKSQIRFSLLEKNYQSSETSSLKYNSLGVNFKSSQRIKRKGKPSNYISFELDFRRRNYMRTIFGEALDEGFEEELDDEGLEDFEEVEDQIQRRIWQYHTAQVEYTFAQSKTLKVKTGLAFQQRLDLLDKKFGYHQWQPYVKLEMKKERLKFAWKVEGVLRSFSHLKAKSGSEDLLKHKYLRSTLSLDYAMTKNLDFTVRGNFRNRWRNFSNGATSFLPYTNGMISAGIKYRF